MKNDDSSRQNGYDHYGGTSAKSDRGRRGLGDDRSPLWDPTPVDKSRYTNGLQRRPGMHYRQRTEKERNPSQSDSDRSNSGNRSTRSTQSRGSDRGHHTQTRYGQENTAQGRENSTTQRERSRYNELMTRIARLPNQIMRPPDHQFQGQSHPKLPIRSLNEELQPC
jgi:hypothetical protein